MEGTPMQHSYCGGASCPKDPVAERDADLERSNCRRSLRRVGVSAFPQAAVLFGTISFRDKLLFAWGSIRFPRSPLERRPIEQLTRKAPNGAKQKTNFRTKSDAPDSGRSAPARAEGALCWVFMDVAFQDV